MSTHPVSKYDNGRKPAPLLERIKANCKINKKGCWLWLGAKSKEGYGRTTIGSRRDGSRRRVYCHVATWEHVNGPKPKAKTLDHVVCDTPACCNPEHVEPASMRDNTLRSKTAPTAINARKKKCPKCGGPYSRRSDGKGRYCRPCALAYFREYNKKR